MEENCQYGIWKNRLYSIPYHALLSGQNPLISSPGLYISIDWSNGIDGTRASWSSILLVISVVQVYCGMRRH